MEYSVTFAQRGIEYGDTETNKITYELEFAIEDMNEDRFSALILYLQQATAKGSIFITRAFYSAADKKGIIELETLMTANSDLLLYAEQLEEEAEANQEGDEE